MTLHPLLNWFANNTVAANLLIILIIVTGLIAYPSIRQEPFASIPLDLIAITVNYPGATPDEVEQAVCVPIEEAIKDVPGIGRVRSQNESPLSHKGLGWRFLFLVRKKETRQF